MLLQPLLKGDSLPQARSRRWGRMEILAGFRELIVGSAKRVRERETGFQRAGPIAVYAVSSLAYQVFFLSPYIYIYMCTEYMARTNAHWRWLGTLRYFMQICRRSSYPIFRASFFFFFFLVFARMYGLLLRRSVDVNLCLRMTRHPLRAG